MLSETGDISTMRVMSFLSLLIGAAIAVFGLWHGKDMSGLAVLVSAFVGPAFVGKAAQSFAEKPNGQ